MSTHQGGLAYVGSSENAVWWLSTRPCIAKEDGAERYLGEQQYTHAQALLKIFDAPLAAEDATRFRDEARRLSSLVHPHLVRIFDFGVDAETAFLVMEYPPEGTLRDQHPAGTVLPAEQVLRSVQQIADALYYLHDQDLAHGDLRPEHLWLRRQDEVLVGDPLLPSFARPISIVSNPYLAPEQAEGSATPASDQYALGAIVFEWLSGAPPEGPAQAQQPDSRLQRSPLRERLPDLAPAIERTVLKALAPDPVQRFPTLQGFADALQEAIQTALATLPATSSALTAAMPPEDMPGLEMTMPAAEPVLLERPKEQAEAPTPPAHQPLQTTARTSPAPQPAVNVKRMMPATRSQHAKPRTAPPAAAASSNTTKEETLPPFHWPDDDQPSILRKAHGSPEGPPQPERRQRGPIATGLSILLLICAVVRLCGALGLLPDLRQSTTSGSHTPTLPTYPTPATTILTYRGHHATVYAVAWSPNGKYIASGDGDGNVEVWEADNGHLITAYHTQNWAVAGLA